MKDIEYLLGGYIGWIIGMSAAKVGDIPKPSTEPYGWWIPIFMGAIVILPAILGYLVGKDTK